MNICLRYRVCSIIILVFSGLLHAAHARENTFSSFKYATPIILAPVGSARLAELALSDDLYAGLREDLADLRVVQDSNKSSMPVMVRSLKEKVHQKLTTPVEFERVKRNRLEGGQPVIVVKRSDSTSSELITGVAVHINRINYYAELRVESSVDGLSWRALDGVFCVMNMGAPAQFVYKSQIISFRPVNSNYLKLTVVTLKTLAESHTAIPLSSFQIDWVDGLSSRTKLVEKNVIVSHKFTPVSEPPLELKKRFSGRKIIMFESGKAPLNTIKLSSESGWFKSGYTLLGRVGARNDAGAEWRVLSRGTILDLKYEKLIREDLEIKFDEFRSALYALVFEENAPLWNGSVAAVYGPVYHAYFQVLPGRSYTLLSNHPDATPVAEFNTSNLELLLSKGVVPVNARVGNLLDNKSWKKRGWGYFTKDKMFVLPVVVVVALIIALLLFVMIGSITNRKKPLKMAPRPFLRR